MDSLNKKPTFYLAHPILSRAFVREWELRIEKEIGIDLKNPFYDGKGYESGNIQKIDAGKLDVYDRKLDWKVLVETDLDSIDSCDGVLAICDDNLTIGTPMELMYAKLHGIPIITICTNKRTQFHPWVRYCSDKTFESFEAFESWAKPQYATYTQSVSRIALTGKAQSGKDTVAQMMDVDFNFKFAAGVKDVVAKIFGFTRADLQDKPPHVRQTLQLFATEGVRSVYPNAWVEQLERKLQVYERVFPLARTVVTDLRFLNEVPMLRNHGYVIVNIVRPVQGSALKDLHQSETELESIKADYTITNDGTKEQLLQKVALMVRALC